MYSYFVNYPLYLYGGVKSNQPICIKKLMKISGVMGVP